MRRLVIPAAVAAALALAPTPGQAQIVIGSGYAQPYYGGFGQPYYGGAAIGNGGIVQAAEGYLLNQAGLGGYAPYTSGYGSFGNYYGNSFGNYGYQPYSGYGYNSYGNYYGGNAYRSYGGGRWMGRRR